ncbi:MAG: ABC transporter ATP-binding protein [Coprobacillaceae bacterium]
MKKSLKQNLSLFILSIILAFICAIASVVSSKILQKVIDSALAGDMVGFKEILLFSIIFLVVVAILSYLYGRVNNKFTNYIIRDYRKQIYSGIMDMSYKEFNKRNSGDYLSALTNDLKMVEENYILSMLDIIQYVFVFIATVVMLFLLNIKVAIALIISVLIMFIVPSLLGKSLQDKQDIVSTNIKHLTTKTKDILSGFEVIKSFHSFSHFKKLFMKENNRVVTSKIDSDNLLKLNESISEILGTLCQFVVIFMSSYLIIEGEITAGTTVALIQLSGAFIMPVVVILNSLPKIKGIEPIINKLDELTNTTPMNKLTINNFETAIDIKDLTFSYDGINPVLKNINLEIKKGQKYAIIGKSGCGKTTLTNLISGYYKTYSGDISYDGKNISEYDVQSSSNLISTIHQNVYMFDSSIKDNITLYDSYSNEEMQNTLTISGVDTFIIDFDQGIESQVGENGNKLSGGQRQRIAIARALIKNTPIVILDEGTSAIDKQTAYDIEKQLLNIPGLTLITITHNLDQELLEHYDSIVYMAEGKINQMGHFTNLLNNTEFYKYYHRLSGKNI